jgi:hypothetical protein
MARFAIKKIGSRRVCRRAGGSYPILILPSASARVRLQTRLDQLFQKCSDWAQIWLRTPWDIAQQTYGVKYRHPTTSLPPPHQSTALGVKQLCIVKLANLFFGGWRGVAIASLKLHKTLIQFISQSYRKWWMGVHVPCPQLKQTNTVHLHSPRSC